MLAVADWRLYEGFGPSTLGYVLSHCVGLVTDWGAQDGKGRHARCIVGVSAYVIFVRGHESYAGLRIEAECQSCNHL